MGFTYSDRGLRGPFLNEPAIALALKVANGERLCLLWRAWGTAHRDRDHREGPVIAVLSRGCGSEAAWTQTCSKASKQSSEHFPGGR